MATMISRPTAILYVSQSSAFFEGATDGDPSAYGSESLYGTGTSVAVYGGFDFSALPTTATIKTITVFVKAYSSKSITSFSNRLVKNTTGVSDYTDLGDDTKNFVSSATISSTNYYSASYPMVASTVTADFLRSGALQSRLYLKTSGTLTSTTVRLYDLYIEVEYELPTIAVTVNTSPAEGGTVTGGGTYESGSIVTATATPNEGYAFSHWLLDGTDSGVTEPTISGTLTSDMTVTAVFEPITLPEISSVQITPNPCEAGQGFIISVGFM